MAEADINKWTENFPEANVTFVGDLTTGINPARLSLEDGYPYNLGGQRIQNDHKGIIILNGRKLFVK